MSAIFHENFKCFIYGCKFTSPELWSTSKYGSPDLNLRSAELSKWTIDARAQCCPNCRYVSNQIDKNGTQHKNYINQTENRKLMQMILMRISPKSLKNSTVALQKTECKMLFFR